MGLTRERRAWLRPSGSPGFIAASKGFHVEVTERHHDDKENDGIGGGDIESDLLEGDLVDLGDPDLGRSGGSASGHDVDKGKRVEVGDDQEQQGDDGDRFELRHGDVPEAVPGAGAVDLRGAMEGFRHGLQDQPAS